MGKQTGDNIEHCIIRHIEHTCNAQEENNALSTVDLLLFLINVRVVI